jgi:hypothetical protein
VVVRKAAAMFQILHALFFEKVHQQARYASVLSDVISLARTAVNTLEHPNCVP